MALGVGIKRSVTIAGHETSVSLEPVFWTALEAEAARDSVPLNALVARIDAGRLDSQPAPNLTSAIRQYLLLRALDR
jgi:predicted DNA-binding ribbon-helix-helix protein